MISETISTRYNVPHEAKLQGQNGQERGMIRSHESKISRILDTMLPVDSEAQAAQRQLAVSVIRDGNAVRVASQKKTICRAFNTRNKSPRLRAD
ncbi:MAG TPA: hypothetical protein VKE70_26375 [Candidatus Solibacter sp.]|nr:hypothetical protein [Candidatus Solibacter sp.]